MEPVYRPRVLRHTLWALGYAVGLFACAPGFDDPGHGDGPDTGNPMVLAETAGTDEIGVAPLLEEDGRHALLARIAVSDTHSVAFWQTKPTGEVFLLERYAFDHDQGSVLKGFGGDVPLASLYEHLSGPRKVDTVVAQLREVDLAAGRDPDNFDPEAVKTVPGMPLALQVGDAGLPNQAPSDNATMPNQISSDIAEWDKTCASHAEQYDGTLQYCWSEETISPKPDGGPHEVVVSWSGAQHTLFYSVFNPHRSETMGLWYSTYTCDTCDGGTGSYILEPVTAVMLPPREVVVPMPIPGPNGVYFHMRGETFGAFVALW